MAVASNEIPTGRDQNLPSAAALAATQRPLAEARTLPSACYTSKALFDLEQRELFGRMWMAMCREEDLADKGDFITRTIGGERVLLVRGRDDEIRAFYNVCRHRGSRVVEEDAGKKMLRISCPYHAWTYGTDGRLISAPQMGKDFCREDFPLRTVRMGNYGGYVFINFDENAPSLDEAFGDLPDLSRYRMGELRRAAKTSYEVNANWKLVCENYSECYHCALVHPQLNRLSDFLSGNGMETGESFNGGPMCLNEGFTTLSMSGQTEYPVIPDLSEEDHKLVHYYVVYPNLLLGLHPDYVLVHTAWPAGPDRTVVECEWLYTEEALATEGFDPADAVEFWDLTNRQDWGLCERVQRGAGSRGYTPGPYHDSESCVHEFDRWYAEKMSAILERHA